jgi:N6-adenosine-specific RNA methylase IME4
VKQNPNGQGLFTGMGYWTRANSECCLLATRGSPVRIARDLHQVITAPVAEHSRKPDEARLRIQRLLNGPYLELCGRLPVDGWTVWGNEVPLTYDAQGDIRKSVEVGFATIRERTAKGGPGWGEPYPELPAFLNRNTNPNNRTQGS